MLHLRLTWISASWIYCLTVADTIELIDQLVNASLKALWSKVVNDFYGFLTSNREVKEILQVIKEFDREGFSNMIGRRHWTTNWKERKIFTDENLYELLKSVAEEEAEKK